MTYGWAILVVISAIAALAYFGVLEPCKILPNECGNRTMNLDNCIQLKDVHCYTYNETGAMCELITQNVCDVPITVIFILED